MNAAAILMLAEKGLSALEIAELASLLEKPRDRTGAERQARYRERHKVTRDVTRDEIPSPLVPPKSSPEPPKNNPPISPNPPIDDGRATTVFPPPSGVEKGQWRAFRQQRKKPLNERSYTLLTNKLARLAEDGWPPGEMIDLAIERGWETVFEPKDQANGRTPASVCSMGGPRPDPTLALVRAATAAQREDAGDHGQARFALPSR